ncbi:MAG: L-fucose/L-arabinose isomerase family protein [Anaerolineae bacterium]|nr:L-fucose/L-arabinose isomerase family protein [Anaerolineae bacterium]
MSSNSSDSERAVTFEDLFKRDFGSAKIGVFGCGCWFYWDQFPGLKERLIGHQEYFEEQIRGLGMEVVSGGLVDTPQLAAQIGDKFRREGIDFLMCYMSTYALSSTVLPVVQRAGVPLLMISLQPSKAMDYANGTTFMQLEHDNATSLPEVCNALRRANIEPAGMVVGTLRDDPVAWGRIADWCKVARAHAVVRNARIGVMGHVYEGMLDMNSDPTMFDAHFGLHCEHMELDDLAVRVDAVSEHEIARKLEEIHALFDFPEPGADPIAGPAKPEDVRWAAQVACGLDRLFEDFNLTALSYYYRGLNGNAYERLGSTFIVGSSLLTGRGFPVAGELDIKNCLAMLIVDRLEAGGSFAEIHPCDFDNDIILVGHDGPHHIGVAEGRPVLRGLSVYHGKRGYGVGVEFQLKVGPITLVGLSQTYDGRFRFVVAEGESLPGPIPPTGNTNTRGRFPPNVATFIENWSLEGPTHHFALGIGHIAHQIENFARCWGIECINVTDPLYRRPQYIRR